MVGAAEMRWWSASTVAVVTGANKGVGYEVSRQLARNGLTTVMTARDASRGRKAVETLRSELGSDAHIDFHPLDVTSPESAIAFSKWLQDTYGGADILVNNAGIMDTTETAVTVLATLQTNYYGVKNVTKAMLPVLRPSPVGARVIMTSSALGQLHPLKNHYRKELENREQLTEETVDEFVESYLEEIKTGKGPGGWPGWSTSYCISKMAVNAYMSILARETRGRGEGHKVFVNSFTPGYTSTSMTGGQGHSVEEGAMTAVWLALHPAHGHPHGKFWADKCCGEMSF